MSIRFFLVTFLFISSVFGNESFACTFCNALAQNAQDLVGKNEQEILSILEVVSETLCSELPDRLSPSQCKSGIRMYGPYIVELLASGIEQSQVCGQIGLCDASEKYSILWPSSINQNGITYSAKAHLEKSSTQFFKIFLGDYSSLDEEKYSLFTSLKGFSGTSLSIKLTNNIDFVETESCEEGIPCSIKTSKPGRRVWCYITLNSMDSEKETDFELEIVEKNAEDEKPVQKRRNNPKTIIIFTMAITMMITFIICCAATKCIFGRRKPKYETGNYIFEELVENPPMMVFIPSAGGYVPAYAPLTMAQV
jgi:hypothetical protein